MPTANKKKHLRKFTKVLTQLLETLHDVFPTCDATADAYLKFAAANEEESVKKKAIAEWNRTLRPYYNLCEAGKWQEVFDSCDNEVFVSLSLKDKWNTLDEASQGNLVQYIKALNKHAVSYFDQMMSGIVNAFPPSLMERMQTVASDIAQGAADNNGDIMSQLKFDEIGKRVFGGTNDASASGGVDSDELQTFGSAIPQILPDLMEMTQALVGKHSIVSQLGSLLGGSQSEQGEQ